MIICTTAMFDEVREWNRDHIENYVEIFLDVDMEVLRSRNRKGLYSQKDGKIAGIDVSQMNIQLSMDFFSWSSFITTRDASIPVTLIPFSAPKEGENAVCLRIAAKKG